MTSSLQTMLINHRTVWWRKWNWGVAVAVFAIFLFLGLSLFFISPNNTTHHTLSANDLVPLTLLRNANLTGAFCLDGSFPGYHFQKGFGSGSRNWLLHLQGGAWCNSIASCSDRKTTDLGSSKYMDHEVEFPGILSSDPSQNPGIPFASEFYLETIMSEKFKALANQLKTIGGVAKLDSGKKKVVPEPKEQVSSEADTRVSVHDDVDRDMAVEDDREALERRKRPRRTGAEENVEDLTRPEMRAEYAAGGSKTGPGADSFQIPSGMKRYTELLHMYPTDVDWREYQQSSHSDLVDGLVESLGKLSVRASILSKVALSDHKRAAEAAVLEDKLLMCEVELSSEKSSRAQEVKELKEKAEKLEGIVSRLEGELGQARSQVGSLQLDLANRRDEKVVLEEFRASREYGEELAGVAVVNIQRSYNVCAEYFKSTPDGDWEGFLKLYLEEEERADAEARALKETGGAGPSGTQGDDASNELEKETGV